MIGRPGGPVLMQGGLTVTVSNHRVRPEMYVCPTGYFGTFLIPLIPLIQVGVKLPGP